MKFSYIICVFWTTTSGTYGFPSSVWHPWNGPCHENSDCAHYCKVNLRKGGTCTQLKPPGTVDGIKESRCLCQEGSNWKSVQGLALTCTNHKTCKKFCASKGLTSDGECFEFSDKSQHCVCPSKPTGVKLEPPQQLTVLVINHRSKPISAECIVERSRPAAKIRWYLGSQELTKSLLPMEVIEEDDLYYTVRQTYAGRVTWADLGGSLRCVAEHPLLHAENSMEAAVTLNMTLIKKPNNVKIMVGPKRLIKVGGFVEKLQVTCISEGGRPPPTFRWQKGLKRINRGLSPVETWTTEEGVTGAKQTMTWLSDWTDHEKRVLCEVVHPAMDRQRMLDTAPIFYAVMTFPYPWNFRCQNDSWCQFPCSYHQRGKGKCHNFGNYVKRCVCEVDKLYHTM